MSQSFLKVGDDHIHDQHEYPIDYADDDEDFELCDHDSLYNIEFEIGENSNLNGENENEFIDDETDDTIANDNMDLQKDHVKPKINSTVDSYGATLSMYKNYASEVGFDVSLGTTKFDIITQRHLLCNREDEPRTAKVDTLEPQHNKIPRIKTHLGANAKQKLFLFYYVEIFIHNLSKQNIGASRAHRLYTRLQGGSYVRCGLVSDFKNNDCPALEMPLRESFYNQIIGVESTNDVSDIENPFDILNKGTDGRGKRLKSKKEMLEKESLKPKQKCASCKQMASHNK
ncbi:unnamed protein product [Lactuca saligna]|uniref:Protein FAR1-RELATED SEQUENCE n=1 Tax=Lactuca saligna TaxID=75948 RepID=A0AA35ZMY0_LACSI|nr:unnamed protein product [Lactuca saligna]